MDASYEFLPTSYKAIKRFNERIEELEGDENATIQDSVRAIFEIARSTLQALATLELQMLVKAGIVSVALGEDGKAYIRNSETGAESRPFETDGETIELDIAGIIADPDLAD